MQKLSVSTKDYLCDILHAQDLRQKLQETFSVMYGPKAKVWIVPEFLGNTKIYNIRSNVKFDVDSAACLVGP